MSREVKLDLAAISIILLKLLLWHLNNFVEGVVHVIWWQVVGLRALISWLMKDTWWTGNDKLATGRSGADCCTWTLFCLLQRMERVDTFWQHQVPPVGLDAIIPSLTIGLVCWTVNDYLLGRVICPFSLIAAENKWKNQIKISQIFLFREKSWAGPWAMGKLRPKVHQVSNTWPKEEIVHMATVLLCAADGRKITCGRRFNALFFFVFRSTCSCAVKTPPECKDTSYFVPNEKNPSGRHSFFLFFFVLALLMDVGPWQGDVRCLKQFVIGILWERWDIERNVQNDFLSELRWMEKFKIQMQVL